MRIARIFPRKTKATPDDDLVFFNGPPRLDEMPEIEEVHVSCTFTYDKPIAEEFAFQWAVLGVPVKVGGPAYDAYGDLFTPGMYIKQGYVMTSRGCNNHCWFCMVPKREGPIREIPVMDGYNIIDSNLLQCSDEHINAVFDMLERQKENPEFTGGLEAKILKPWHCKRMKEIKTKRAYFAYDTPDDYEPLVYAGRMMIDAGFTVASKALCCYCLIGYKGDTFEKAEERMTQAIKAGFAPYAMLYRDEKGKYDREWYEFQKSWLKPEWVNKKISEVRNKY
ncbi:MAG: hypothetical protein Q8873_00370 [Bacillota bacterium]|nr:hypothetical protein [Bacillota bacterium]